MISSTQELRGQRINWLTIVLVILVITAVSYRLGQSDPTKTQWSSHSMGPLICVSNGSEMQCAARNIVMQAPPGYVPQSMPVQPELSAQQLGCVALAVFAEARGESWQGQAAVAQVVLNRAMKAAQTPCDTVTQVAQFQAVERLTDDPWRIDADAWEQSLLVAREVFSGDYDTGACHRATAFHSGTAPSWAASSKLVCQVGAHKFYSVQS